MVIIFLKKFRKKSSIPFWQTTTFAPNATTLIFAVSFILSPKRRKTGIIPEECGFCSQTIAGKTYCLDENCTHLDIPHKHDDEGLIIYKTDLKPKKEKTIHKHTSKVENS